MEILNLKGKNLNTQMPLNLWINKNKNTYKS